MRARRRPAAVIGLWATQAALALLVAWPAAKAVASAYGDHPSGDAPLWEPGALALADLLQHATGAVGETASLLLCVLLVSAVAELVPVGALLASIAFVTRERRAPSLRASIERGARAFGTFFTLLAGSTLVQILIAVLALSAAIATSRGFSVRLGDARAQQLAGVVGILVGSAAWVVAVVQDGGARGGHSLPRTHGARAAPRHPTRRCAGPRRSCGRGAGARPRAGCRW